MRTSKRIPKVFISVFTSLSPAQAREVLQFALFLKSRSLPDPDQAYFWTRKWLRRERSATRDKRFGRILGDGTADGLIDSLNK